MKVEYGKNFLKQLTEIPKQTRGEIEYFVFQELVSANTLAELGKVEKMQGYDGFYKARFGDFRVGLLVNDNLVTVKTVMHRKEIYRFFP